MGFAEMGFDTLMEGGLAERASATGAAETDADLAPLALAASLGGDEGEGSAMASGIGLHAPDRFGDLLLERGEVGPRRLVAAEELEKGHGPSLRAQTSISVGPPFAQSR